jgi:putative Holliday junction resolvase
MSDFTGPVLGIDHGQKFIGLAISRSLQFAEPLHVIARKSKAQDFARIQQIIADEGIRVILLGLPPTPPDFVGHSQADTVRNWAEHLAAALDVPIFLWDEGLSSVDAEARLAETGQQRDRVDAHAAAVILQSCIDSLRDDGPAPIRFVPKNPQ